ncbi:MAG: flagellar hook-associated protein FlgK [Alphaproteobacteria bacterium]|nr:flagellar hook-associated protein FlgK [Alphaproteobacteria bacterium]
MTYQALTTAITGLRAAQAQISAISNNVTNATTPGYNRQIVPQSTQVLREAGKTVGVLTEPVIRVVDMNLQRDLWTQVSATSMQDVQINYLQQIQNFNGPPDKEFSIAAQLGQLRDSFSALSDIPDDMQALEATLNQAERVANKFNDYAELLTTLRNDTQTDLESSVNRVNSLLQEITNINKQIQNAENLLSSVAGLQDQRDIAIKSLTEEMDISFFERSDGVLVVQTVEGVELAGDVAHSLEFQNTPISALQYYPETASALVVNNVTNGRTTSINITERVVGGRMGGLIELRDTILPSYQAQIDELAFQTAHRFEAQGLQLFTDQNGLMPTGAAPDPSTLPLPTPVDYVDFSRVIQVNRDIVNDISLLQRGTETQDITLPTGDNSVIRRVLEYTFGDIEYQEAVGTTNLDDIAGGANDLQEWLGLSSTNRVVTGVDLGSFLEIDDGVAGTNTDIIESFQDFFLNYPLDDQFQITFEEARGVGFGPTTITVDLSDADANFPIGGGTNDALDQIIAEINAQAVGAGLTPDQALASRNNYGQLVLESTGNITIDGSSFAGAMGTDALDRLGIQEGTFVTEDPNFNIQVGNYDPVNITIEPGETINDLITKLEWNNATQTGVPGLHVDYNAGTGTLTLRPGIDDTNFAPLDTGPVYGGDITITAGPFDSDPASALEPTLAALPQPVDIVSAIFGSYTVSGGTVTTNSPTTDVNYQFETFNGSGSFVNFRNNFLGPNAAVSTDIYSSTNLLDFSQKIINATAHDFLEVQSAYENEDTLRGILQRQFSDKSGVNIDEEMSNLIIVQTAYASAARVITAADEMFQELINAFR